MIFPSLFGTSIKNNDKIWETSIVSYFGMDTLNFRYPEKFTNVTYVGMDCLNFENPTKTIYQSYFGIDILNYSLNNLTNCSYIGLDVLIYKT